MKSWETILPERVKYLKYYALSVMVLSVVEFLSFVLVVVLLKRIPSDFVAYSKFVTLFADFFLGILVLQFIDKNYPNCPPSVNQQYKFLLLIYLTVFSLIIYFSGLYEVAAIVFSLGDLIFGLELSGNLIITITVLIAIVVKIVSLLLLQTKGFKLVKEIRSSFRESNDQKTDLL